jgi:hypothetical protein
VATEAQTMEWAMPTKASAICSSDVTPAYPRHSCHDPMCILFG